MPTFTLNPAAVVKDEVYDYSNKTHRALYSQATEKLYQDDKDRFDLTPTKVQNFLDRLFDRAQECNITVINCVPKNLSEVSKQNPQTINMCLHHGELSEELLRKFAETYIGKECRQAQDDHIVIVMLQKALNEISYQTVKAERTRYLVAGHECGILMLKIALRNSATDASINVDVIRVEISNAYRKFAELNFNVRDFNDWILLKINQLRQQGQITTDLRSHLLTAYECSNDEEFTRYIGQQRDQISDNPSKEYTYAMLMTRAKDKYDRLETNRRIMAIKGGPREEPINALTALVAQVAALEKKLGGNGKSKDNDNTDEEQPERKTKGDRKKRPFIPKELFSEPPPDDISKPKEIDGKKYWFCPVHRWSVHPFTTQGDTKGCPSNFLNRKKKDDSNGQSQQEQQSTNDKQGDRRGRVVKAYNALIAKPKV